VPKGRKPIPTALAGWENFYVIVGSSADALIGLQFVIITLIADMPIARADAQAGGAFTTPSVVHFGVVMLLSTISPIKRPAFDRGINVLRSTSMSGPRTSEKRAIFGRTSNIEL
jgi:hypothetical protein